jgi:membrane-bound lytic murein transglycosylase A
LVLEEVGYDDLPGWKDDRVGEAVPALRKSCNKIAKLPDDRALGGQVDVTAGDWRRVCELVATLDPADHAGARAMFEAELVPHAASAGTEPVGRFTGYYEAWMNGSMKRHGKYQTPLYKAPSDLVTVNLADMSKHRSGRIYGRLVKKRLKPYYTRGEIMDGALKGNELLWVDDPVDAFFAQVQGSGRVKLDDGSEIRAAYAGKNGRAYTAIGRVLIAEGHLTKQTVSMQSIRAYLAAHPERQDEIFRQNEGFVFFEINKGPGPYGSQGVVLTPGRSVAIDREFLPHTTPIFVDTMAPVAGQDREEPFQQLLIAQDTGGAITGPVRGDIYFGGDEDAADRAGRMKGTGRYYLLLPRKNR